MQTIFVQIQHLAISIGKSAIIQHAQLDAMLGQAIAIVGNNGCGKTTLLKAIAGILRPTIGSISIANLNYNNFAQAMKIKQLLGYAPDTPPLYSNDTIRNYLYFIARLKRIPRASINNRIDACLEIFDLTEMQNKYIGTLSKGTQQRVNLAQAVLNEPKLLLLDEPSNALDLEHNQALRDYLLSLKKSGTTIFMISHSYDDIIPVCDYLLKIANKTTEIIHLPAENKIGENNYAHSNITA